MLQFNLMVLVFAVIALVRLRQSVEAAMLDVLLPVLFLMPAIYFLRIPHIPLLACYDVILYPVGIAAIVRHFHNWRFQRTDLWVCAFAIAGFVTDYINLDLKTAIYNFAESGFLGGVLAYFIGKLLIEQTGNREQLVKRVVVLLATVGVLSVSEFVAKRNLFVAATHRFFGQVDYWGDQYRAGFLRVKGPFMGAEEAGIVFVIGFFLSLWLWFLNRQMTDTPEPKHLGLRRSTIYCGAIMLGLLMTLSRGPLLGAAAGYLIARIGLTKGKRLAMVVALLLLTAGGVVVHEKAASFARAETGLTHADAAASDESKASAAYRTQLFEVYEPIAEEGGWFGWSATAFPRQITYWSIDNEYLLLWVAQGKIGITLFLLIMLEGTIGLVRAILGARRAIDASLYYCLAGMLFGVAVILTTVFLSGQGFLLFFFCIGWIHSLPSPQNSWWEQPEARFAFRRVYT